MWVAAAAACDPTAGRAGTRGGASRAAIHRTTEGPEALTSFQQLKSHLDMLNRLE